VSELETAVAIVLDDARPQLEPVRAQFHAGSVAMGIPLHVTLLYPFAPAGRIDDRVLAELADFFGKRDALTLTLVGLAEFPGVVYAVPEPRDELVAMMHALYDQYPEYPPYEGEFPDPVPHASLAELGEGVSQEDVVAQIRARTDSLFPLACAIRDVALLEERAPDRWRERQRFPLRSS
jgi:2'-5' RNA ligase